MTETSHWQLQMFQKTLKKKLRLKHLRHILGTLREDAKCLLVTCGDNNGAINYYLRELGGEWSFADLEPDGIGEMSDLLGVDVLLARQDQIPYPDGSFDWVVAIDAHEHVSRPDLFTAELYRIMKDNGRIVITVPGGDPTRTVNRIKNWIGMTKDKYGHVRDGFSTLELNTLMQSSGLEPGRDVTFSRFFTEMIELAINFVYVKVLSPGGPEPVRTGTIAPQTLDQIQSIRKTYRMYAAVYPLFWLVSQLDRLLFFSPGYVVMVQGRKDEVPA
ncbi:MAG: methyltransferase domain-containing protein [Rhodothermales bacterium]|nr:methyltransferase domain-containing protein [Rhodothermales bacterium]